MKIEVYHTTRTRVKECFSRSEDLFEEVDTLVQQHDEATPEDRKHIQKQIDYKIDLAKDWIETAVSLIQTLNN